MSENNYELLRAQVDVKQQQNVEELCKRIAVAYKRAFNLTIYIDVIEDGLCHKGKMQLERFLIKHKGEQIGIFYMFRPDYRQAKLHGIMPTYFSMKDATLNSQFKKSA